MNHFPVKGGIFDMISPPTIMTYESLHYKNISFYRLDSNLKYMSNTPLVTSIIHAPKVQYAWDQAEIYNAGSSL